MFEPTDYIYDYSSNATYDNTYYEDFINTFSEEDYEKNNEIYASLVNTCDYSQASSNGWNLFVKTNFLFGFVIPVFVSYLLSLLKILL